MAPMHNVTIDDKELFGVFMLVDSNTYAEIAATALYQNQGASYVVNQRGVIELRPNKSAANNYFGGYNLLHTLREKNVDEQQIHALQRGCKSSKKSNLSQILAEKLGVFKAFPIAGATASSL